MRSKAAVLHEFNQPVSIEEIEVAPPKAHEVLVRVVNAGVCHSELAVIKGTRPAPLPVVLGHEGAGIIEEIGPGVSAVKPGDHVILLWRTPCNRCKQCAAGRPALCETAARASVKGTLIDGTTRFSKDGDPIHHLLSISCFSEYTVMHENGVVPIPADIPMPVAATMGCAIMTGVGAVVNTAKVKAGSSVAIFGVGGVGLSAIMGARLAGATQIIAVDLKAGKLEIALSLGATRTVNSSHADPVQAIQDITGGEGVDYAFEVTGFSSVLEQAFASTARGGTSVMVGVPSADEVVHVPAQKMFAEERTLRASYYGSTQPYRDVPWMTNLYRNGLLPVDKLISRHYMLHEYNEALRALQAGEVARSVLDVTDL